MAVTQNPSVEREILRPLWKVPILLHSGFWRMAHEARTDFAMTLGLLFLLSVGAGRWSWDARRHDN